MQKESLTVCLGKIEEEVLLVFSVFVFMSDQALLFGL